jgi:uncharacterized membrane protein YdjX (TVP38/TMEM64 family)
MGTLGTAIMMFGLVVTMIATLTSGVAGALVSLLIVGTALLLLMTKDKHGHSALQRLSTRIGWQRAKMARHNVYRSGPLGRTSPGTR